MEILSIDYLIKLSYYALLPLIFYILYLIFKKTPIIKAKCIQYILINNKTQLDLINEKIMNFKIDIIGLDTEYYRGDHYNGNLCIIQLALPVHGSLNQIEIYIIDLLSFESLSDREYLSFSLSKFLSNEGIEKVIHSCENDIEWIYDEFKVVVRNIFDTQEIYESLHKCKKKTGLNILLNKYFDLNLNNEEKKRFQKSNWKIRPLSKAQLNYAAMDAYYLIQLRHILKEELYLQETNANKIMNGMRNERKLLSMNKKERSEIKAINYLVSNITKCEEETLEKVKTIYINLYKKNDEMAFKININPDKILSLKMIYKISTRLPKRKEDLILLIKNDSKHNFDFECYSELINELHKLLLDHNIEECIFNENDNKEYQSINNGNILINPRQQRKMINKEKIIKKFSCKKPVYENCHMFAPDGELLCFCDQKKMEWYVKRGLACIINENPPSFKLFFEPNGRGCKDEGDVPSDFYVRYRKNCCVVCGFGENYMRFHVVPVLYRQFFPEELKSHKSHDVVLLCFGCHEKANQVYDIQKKIISEKFDIPLNMLSDDQLEIKQIEVVIRYAKTLHKNYGVIPEDKKELFSKELIYLLQEYKENKKFNKFYHDMFHSKGINVPSNTKELNKDLLNILKSYNFKTNSCNGEKKNHHGKLVVDQIKDFTEFIKEWRVFFIEAFQPKFLPDEWNVEHQFYRTFGEHSKFSNVKG